MKASVYSSAFGANDLLADLTHDGLGNRYVAHASELAELLDYLLSGDFSQFIAAAVRRFHAAHGSIEAFRGVCLSLVLNYGYRVIVEDA